MFLARDHRFELVIKYRGPLYRNETIATHTPEFVIGKNKSKVKNMDCNIEYTKQSPTAANSRGDVTDANFSMNIMCQQPFLFHQAFKVKHSRDTGFNITMHVLSCSNLGKLSETHLKPTYRKISFVYNILSVMQFEYGILSISLPYSMKNFEATVEMKNKLCAKGILRDLNVRWTREINFGRGFFIVTAPCCWDRRLTGVSHYVWASGLR